MCIEDLDIPQHKIIESAQRIIDRANEESRRHGHTQLTNEPLLLATRTAHASQVGEGHAHRR